MMNDSRNVMDEFKCMSHDDIVRTLDVRGVELEVAVENTLRDYNMGTIVRNANAFGVRRVHVIGSKQWNKRGAMMTDKYLSIMYHSTHIAFISWCHVNHKRPVAIDIVAEAKTLGDTSMPKNAVLIFGAEGPGISTELRDMCDETIMIEQRGSTRSINVGVASGIAIYEWVRTHKE